MDEIQFAFMEEWGDYQFDFENNHVSTHFIVSCILVKESNKDRLEYEIERIKNEVGDLNAPKDDKQWNMLLSEIKDLPFTIYAYVFDKRKIREEFGVMHPIPFIKYMNRMIFQDLRRSFEQLDFVVTDHEEKQFLYKWRNYIKNRSIPDLFNYSTFGFNNTQSEHLLQLAGFMAEMLSKGYDYHHSSKFYAAYVKNIKHKMAALNLLPHDYTHYLFDYKPENDDSRYDEVIIKRSVNLAYKYIEKHRKEEDEEEKLRIDFLKFLLFNLKESPLEYVYTQEILDNLNALRDSKLNQHYFRSNIVSKLRDGGLLIASSNKGYKLPVSLNDLYDFVNLSSLTIHPMIQRVSKCRDQILEATNNEVDILDQKEYAYLKRIIEMDIVKGKEPIEK